MSSEASPVSGRSAEKLVYMANQIGKFFASQDAEQAPVAISEHLRKFWDPRMRAGIIAHLAEGGAGLDPLVHKAVERLREMTAAR
jgi:formate dehydrogenase subunit delta